MKAFRDRPEYQRGHDTEILVADWLKERSNYIIPSYDYSGADGDKAPRLEGKYEGYVVPDLDVSKAGNRFWVEVKSKGSAVEWRKTGELRHGIEERLLKHYKIVQGISGSPVWLFIYEEDSAWLLGQTLDALGEPVSVGNDGRGKRIAFWPRNRFRRLELLPARVEARA